MEPIPTLTEPSQIKRPSYKSAAAILLTIAAAFLGVGGAMLSASYDVVSVRERYDDESGCDSTSWDSPGSCRVTLDLDDDMDEPVYLYYELTNFFQNNRYYRRSVSWQQLKGNDLDKDEVPLCKPVRTMEDLGRIPSTLEIGTQLEDDDVANPCGLIAQTVFNDTFILLDPDGKVVPLEFDDLVLDKVSDRYERADDWEKIQWTDVEDGTE
jgi:hypothetical protein